MDIVASRAYETSDQGVLIVDEQGGIVSADDVFLRITGFARHDLLGQTWRVLQGPASAATVLEQIDAALRAGEAFAGTLVHYRANGQSFWDEFSLTPVRDLRSRLTHFVAIVRDLTGRPLQAARGHGVGDERYRQLLENSPAAVVVHGPRSEILFANSSASRILGLSVEQMKGLEAIDPRWKFVHEDGSPVPLEEYPVNRVIATHGAIRDVVFGVERPDRREPVWVMCNGFPVMDAADRLIEIVISFSDVTVLKQAERALLKSEERLRLVLQGSRDAPWDWDLAGDQMYYSPRWWQMIGREFDEVPPSSALWLDYVHPDDRQRVVAVYQDALRDSGESYEVEFRIRHKAGHHVPVLSRAFILRGADGRALRVSGTNTDLTQQKLAEERIHQLAYYDVLTSLPNRRLLMDQLRRALLKTGRTAQKGALLFIDLDNFKVLNDTLGHEVGDRLLRQVADRIMRSVRQVDTVGRLGGDEFLVMLESLGDGPEEAEMAAEETARKIRESLGEPYLLDGRLHHSTPSIGIALFDRHSGSVEMVLKQADLAMYEAKARGRNTVRFFDQSMQASVDERVALERDLRDGLARGELLLHYQAQVDAEAGVFGAEVLARWRHPQRGLVAPGRFIPVAEASGLILPLGMWVLETACRQLVKWSTRAEFMRLTLSVNVSAHQIREVDFVEQVVATLRRTGAPAHLLKLELTESVLAENIDDVIAKMTLLRAHGVCFALDDFGTGYSSLSYLKRLPLDQLKIDQTFVRDVLTDPNDATISQLIITLGDKLGVAVIAEGVENEAQRQFLQANGCSRYQGYLFGKPMAVDEFEWNLLGEVPLR